MITRIIQFSLIFSACISLAANAETEQVRDSLVQFMSKLAGKPPPENWGWNATSDPCSDNWKGITCDNTTSTVKKVILNELNLTGVIDAAALCAAASLAVLSLNSNGVAGELTDDISKCSRLTHIYLRGNTLSGSLPPSLSTLTNLKRLDVGNNGFSGGIPDMSRIPDLLTFLAQDNHLTGAIPNFNFSGLRDFNVSNNDLAGKIPDGGDGGGRFNTSYLGNKGLCGPPLLNTCPPPPPPPPPSPPPTKKNSSKKDFFIYSGYALIGLIILLLIAFKLFKKTKPKGKKDTTTIGFYADSRYDKTSGSSSESKAVGENRSEFSITPESGKNSSALMVLSSPLVNVLKFEDLLRSPAELIGRGRRGSLYKVTVHEGVNLAVKRIRDWDIGRDEFKNRIRRIDQVKHRNVMQIVAFYCSRQEKLLVYQFQENGSLFSLLHGSQNGQIFDWASRLNVAAKLSEALAFMHQGLQADGIAHGNLKSSNILFSKEMEPLISEYGLVEVEVQDQSFLTSIESVQENNNLPSNNAFRADTYSFGVILLELLTGKVVSNGFELARWVNSAIREEWTVEVFDKALIVEGVNEERMVQLLQLALKCINTSSEGRPSIGEVAAVIGSIREQDEKSGSFES